MKAPSLGRGLATMVWLLMALGFLVFFVTDLRLDFAQTQVPCSGPACNYLAISPAEVNTLQQWGWSLRGYALLVNGATVLAVTVAWLLGGLILWRQGGSRIGWSVSMAMIAIPVAAISDVANVAANHPELSIPSAILSSAGTTILLLFVFLFPNGRFYPRWGYIPFLVTWAAFTALGQTSLPVLIILLLLAGYFQILRYRRASTPLERQQTKWVLLGILCLIPGPPVWLLAFGGAEIPAGLPRLLASGGGWFLTLTLLTALPVTMAIAILRYRLWEIDLIIRRTLVYSVLTGLLALVYFGSVVIIQAILRGVTGGDSPLVIVLSTLLIAALFVPLRSGVQQLIDRRFYRRKYDAARTLAAFGAQARDVTDLPVLTERLLGAVQDTMEPAHVGLWLRGKGSP